jgi:hypothetical protein
MQLIDLQSREEMSSKFLNISLLEFYKLYLPKKLSISSTDMPYT